MATSSVDDVSRRPGKALLDVSGQAPSPSKDFYQLLVTDSVVIWRCWPISLRKGQYANPTETKTPLDEFVDSKELRTEIRRILGTEVDERVRRLAEGHVDGFSSLKRNLLLKILKLLDLQSLRMLSACNRFLHRACGDDELWKGIYLSHHGWASADLETLANEISWRTVFFTNRLQLQVLLSRRRRQGNASRPGSNSAFLTSGTE